MNSSENFNTREDFLNTLDDLQKIEQNSDTAGFQKFIDSDINVDEVEKFEFKTIEAIVAFVDILGTSALMKSLSDDNAEEIINKITGIKEIFKNHFATLGKDFESSNLMIISDSYVISIEKKADAFEALLKMLASCQYECLVRYGEALRGGISAGVIIGGHKDRSAIIGPAFINAHELEEKNVIYPRIVIDETILNDTVFFTDNLPIISDKDGLMYLDFATTENFDIETMCAKIQEGCQKLLETPKNPNNLKARQKWNWLHTFGEQKKRKCLNCCKEQKQHYAGEHYGF